LRQKAVAEPPGWVILSLAVIIVKSFAPAVYVTSEGAVAVYVSLDARHGSAMVIYLSQPLLAPSILTPWRVVAVALRL
jgi:hypothetical protein